MKIIRIDGDLPSDLALLAPYARAEGLGIVETLLAEWDSGANRFTEPGEMLLCARIDGFLAGVGGLTRDPHVPSALRMRRFFVHPDFRGHGVGRVLAQHLIDHACAHTGLLTLHAGTDRAARFWEHLSFVAVARERHSHEMKL